MPLMNVEGGPSGAACRGQSVPGSACRRRFANPPAAALLAGQTARERAPDAGRILCLVCSLPDDVVDGRFSECSGMVAYVRRQLHQRHRHPKSAPVPPRQDLCRSGSSSKHDPSCSAVAISTCERAARGKTPQLEAGASDFLRLHRAQLAARNAACPIQVYPSRQSGSLGCVTREDPIDHAVLSRPVGVDREPREASITLGDLGRDRSDAKEIHP